MSRALFALLLALSFQFGATGQTPPPAALQAIADGEALLAKSDKQGALEAFERAVQLAPEYSDAWRMKGVALVGLKNHIEALAACDRAIQLDPGNARAFVCRGSSKKGLSDRAGAIADYTAAIRQDPNYSNAYMNRGSVRYDAGDLDGAIADYDRAIGTNPNNGPAWFSRGVVKRAKGDKAGAAADLKRYLQMEPNGAYAEGARSELAKTGRGGSKLDRVLQKIDQIQQAISNPTAAPHAAPTAAPSPASGPASASSSVAAAPAPAAPTPAPAAAAPVPAASARQLVLPGAYFEQGKWPESDTLWRPLPVTALPDAGPAARAVIPENLDINHLTPIHYHAAISAAKEGMRVLMGPLSAEQEKRFDTKWAPLFEYPCQPVIEYFNKLNPLLNQFLSTRAALHQAMLQFSNVWEEATTAAAMEDEDGVREAMRVCRVHRDNVAALNATLNDVTRKIQELGEPPDPLAHKARARKTHEEASKAVKSVMPGPPAGRYWVMKNLEFNRPKRPGWQASEGLVSGTWRNSGPRVDTNKPNEIVTDVVGGEVKWTPLKRIYTEKEGEKIVLVLEPKCTDVQLPGVAGSSASAAFGNGPIKVACAYIVVQQGYSDAGPAIQYIFQLLPTDPPEPGPKAVPVKLETGWAQVTPDHTFPISFRVDAAGESFDFKYTYQLVELTPSQVGEIEANAEAEAARGHQTTWGPEADAKADAIAFARANQVHFQNELDHYRAELSAHPDRSDRLNYLIMVTEANLQSERDNETTLATGDWTHTRTEYDNWNFAFMASQTQQTAGVTGQAINAEAAVPRLINLLPKELRYTETQRTQAAIGEAIARGDFAGVKTIVGDLAARVHGQAEKDADLYQRAADAGDYVVGVTQALKTGADGAMFVLSFAPGCGLIYPGYLGATGWVEGGPARGVREALAASHPVAMTLVAAYDGYEKKITDPATGQETQGGITGAVTEGAKTAISIFAFQKAVGTVVGAYYRTGKGNPDAPSIESLLGAARRDSRMANGRAKVALFKQRSEALAESMGQNADPKTIAGLRLKAEEAAKAIKCDYAAKTALNQTARAGDTATMNRYLTHENKFMAEVQQKFEQKLANEGWSPQKTRQFSNSASAEKAGMDVDLGIIEPQRLIRVPGKDGKLGPLVSNPEWQAWRKTLTLRNPKTGQLERRSLFEYQEAGQKHLNKAFAEVVGGPGRSTDEAFVNFTTSVHKESYLNTAFLGKEDVPHADFDAIDPGLTQQAADVTMYKVMHNPNAKPAKPDLNRLALTKDPIPDYLFFQEQCRTLVKDMNTKLIGSPGAVLPKAPLARANAGVQQHVLDLRKVMDDFAANRIGPIEADRKIKNLTGGQGLPSVLREYEAILNMAGR